MLRGTRANVQSLPVQVEVPLHRTFTALNVLHATPWTTPADRDTVGRYVLTYEDGSSVTQPIQYGRHVRAWTDAQASSMIPAPAWSGSTRDGLAVNLTTLTWTNPHPERPVRSVTFVSEGTGAALAVLGLTLTGAAK